MNTRPKLREVFFSFFKLGLFGFGGPVALIALMEETMSRKKQWISGGEFAERFIISKLLPGPVAFQMALFVGSYAHSRLGGLLAGVGFLIPGAATILLFAYFYESIQGIELGMEMVAGMRLGALVVIWDSAVRMFEPYHNKVMCWGLMAVGAALMYLAPTLEPLFIILGGLVAMMLAQRTLLRVPPAMIVSLFWLHFKAGAFTFGTGLAIVPVLQHAVVDQFGWLSAKEFLDAVAFGQITPGPVTLTATFIGFRAAGMMGALAATLGMYLPGCLIILGVMPWVFPKLKKQRWLPHFCEGAIAVVIGCIIVASFSLVNAAVSGTRDWGLGIALLMSNIHLKLSGWKVLLIAGAGYWLIHRL